MKSSTKKQNNSKTVGVIINGPIKDQPSLIKNMLSHSTLLLVDGGANYFYHLIQKFKVEKQATALIGDFDSIDPKILNFFEKTLNVVIPLKRAKDQTDFEIAIDYALKHYPEQRISVYGGVGGRVDHSLANLWLLARFDQYMSFESSDEKIFSCSSQRMLDSAYPFLTCVSLFGNPGKVSIKTEDSQPISFLKDFFVVTHSNLKDSFLWVEGGSLLCIQHFKPETPTIIFFRTLQKLINGHIDEIDIDNEKLYLIKNHESLSLSVKIGQTISLIPLFGPVEGVSTDGLKWELNDSLLDFVGISNIALKEKCTVSVQNGCLLCVVNTLIDNEMTN